MAVASCQNQQTVKTTMIPYELFSDWIERANTMRRDVFLNTFFEHFLSYFGYTRFANRLFAVFHRTAFMRTALFLGYCATSGGNYRRFGTTHRYCLQGSGSSPLKMGQISFTKTSVRNYNHSLRNFPHEYSTHLLRNWNLKSRVSVYVYSRK